jgi:agmatine deiminase
MPKLKILKQTPAELGFTFPAEWAPHSGTWFSWPRPEGISFPEHYEEIPANFAAIFREITPRELVHVNVPNVNYEKIVTATLREHKVDLKRVRFHHIKTNENWCRDHGPAFVVRKHRGRKEMAIVDWGFNAWGGKYPPYGDDDAVPTRIAEELGLPVFYPKARRDGELQGVVMEGGAIDVNGRGTLLTTESCLLHKNRNPHLSKKQIEKYLRDYYGQTNILWLGDGIDGDDTDGHIDDLARFINPTTLAVAVEFDHKDENYKILKDNIRRCQLLRDQDGKPFDLCVLPMPKKLIRDGQRLPATYVNFSFVNGAVLVPTFRDKKNDALALELLREALPKHQVIGIDCWHLIWGLGAIHCASQQQPR